MSFCAHAYRRPEQCRRSSDDRDDVCGVRRPVQDRIDPAHEIDARGHHRRGVDERRDRCRAFHRVGEPRIERDLGGLAHSAREQQDPDGHERGLPDAAEVGEDCVVVEAPGALVDEEQRHKERRVADAIEDHRLLGGARRAVAFEPETDEEVRADTNTLPSEEQQQEVVRQHEQQHRGHEQVQVQEELREVLVVLHVADRVEVDEGAHTGHERRHGHRQRVDEQTHVDVQVARRDPREPGLGVGPAVRRQPEQTDEHHDGGDERGCHHQGRDPAGAGLASLRPESSRITKPASGSSGTRNATREHGSGQPFIPCMSSAVAPGRRR